MGILGDIGKIIVATAVGGPAGALAVITVEHGDEIVEGTIDLARQVVKIGEDVYRAIPPEAFALAGAPIHGLLKHEFEDELIMLGYLAGDLAITAGITWPIVGPFGAAPHLYAAGKLLFGKLHHRLMNDQEWEMARYIFRDSSYDRSDIYLTNMAGQGGRPFTYSLAPLGVPVLVNLAGGYNPNATTPDGPLLFHELTHVWQAKKDVLREIYLYETVPDAVKKDYDFTPGNQWNEYGTEQQAAIVEAWTLGATQKIGSSFNKGASGKLSINSPLFRYINGNVRRSDDGATTNSGGAVRRLLIEGGHETVKDMHPQPPPIWWL